MHGFPSFFKKQWVYVLLIDPRPQYALWKVDASAWVTVLSGGPGPILRLSEHLCGQPDSSFDR